LDSLRTALLWLHVLSAVLWIGSSACVAIAALVASSNQEESRDLNRVIPRLNRLNFCAAIVVGFAGFLNLFLLAKQRGFRFSPHFSAILALKVVIYLLMLSILTAAFRPVVLQGSDLARSASRAAINSAMTVGLGILALGLGIWLAGT
jgi:putative copper export protein